MFIQNHLTYFYDIDKDKLLQQIDLVFLWSYLVVVTATNEWKNKK